jgi:hypothetical protein
MDPSEGLGLISNRATINSRLKNDLNIKYTNRQNIMQLNLEDLPFWPRYEAET